MARQPFPQLLVAQELFLGRPVVEVPVGVELRIVTAPPADAPKPASEADEAYRLIPLG